MTVPVAVVGDTVAVSVTAALVTMDVAEAASAVLEAVVPVAVVVEVAAPS